MKWLNLLFLVGLLIISNLTLVSSFDNELHNCFGDEELIICFTPTDEELIWLGKDIPENVWTGAGAGASHTTVPKEEIIKKEIEPVCIKWIDLRKLGIECVDYKMIYIFLFLLISLFCFLFFRKKKCDECQKRFTRKNLKKYNGKFYCGNCFLDFQKIERFK